MRCWQKFRHNVALLAYVLLLSVSSVTAAEVAPSTSIAVPCSLASDPFSASCLRSARRFALVIGEADYAPQHSLKDQDWEKLPISRQDAVAMARFLSDQGFALVGDGPQLNLTLDQIKSQLSALASLSKGQGAIVVVYVSGHGYSVGGKSYIAATDSVRPIPNIANQTDDALSVEQIDATLSAANPGLTVILLDSCRDGLVSGDQVLGVTDQLSARTVVATATAPGAIVSVMPSSSISVFTNALIREVQSGLKGRSISGMLNDAAIAVEKQTDQQQSPLFRAANPARSATIAASSVFGSEVERDGMVLGMPTTYRLRVGLDYIDSIMACYRPDNPQDLKAILKRQPLFAALLLQAANPTEQKAKCTALEDKLDAEIASNPEWDETEGKALVARSIDLVTKQAAEDGDAHGLLQYFLISRNGLDLVLQESSLKTLTHYDRTTIESLFRSADGGEVMAQLLAGKLLGPRFSKDGYFSPLPGDNSTNLERSRGYLEAALNAGLADAGAVLLQTYRIDLVGQPKMSGKRREWGERTLKAHAVIVGKAELQGVRYDLAADYIDGSTGPVDNQRALAIMRDVWAEPTDVRRLNYSARGLAAFFIAVQLYKRADSSPDTLREAAYFAARAAEFDVLTARAFVERSQRLGINGFQKVARKSSSGLVKVVPNKKSPSRIRPRQRVSKMHNWP